jgi:4,5-DOPA dioxygenase extradiol
MEAVTGNRMPSVFISHGSPMTAIQDAPARRFLLEFGKSLPRPRAILIMTAHFEATFPVFTTDAAPEMIYDFGGFPQPLYDIVWPAPGALDVAQRAAELLSNAGVKCGLVSQRGFDHGTWVPLHLMYPDADIPVCQMSVLQEQGAAAHIDLGRQLAPLRDEGIMIIGSGTVTHNLRALAMSGRILDAPVQPWAQEFAEWIADKIGQGDMDAMAAYRETAPYAQENHPTDEHFLPLSFAMGAGIDDSGHARGKRVHASIEYGMQSMDAYVFG